MSFPRQLHFDVADAIGQLGPAAGVPIVTQLAKAPSGGGYLVQETDIALAALQTGAGGKIGLSIYVQLPVLITDMDDLPTPWFNKTRISIFFFESQLENAGENGFAPDNAGIYCDDLATYVSRALQQYTFGGIAENFVVRECAALPRELMSPELARAMKDAGLMIWTLTLEGSLGTTSLNKVEVPTIAVNAGEVTLSCATGGASLYYTTNKSYPTPTNGTLYAGEFAQPAAGTLLRVVGYLAGTPVQSNVGWQQF